MKKFIDKNRALAITFAFATAAAVAQGCGSGSGTTSGIAGAPAAACIPNGYGGCNNTVAAIGTSTKAQLFSLCSGNPYMASAAVPANLQVTSYQLVNLSNAQVCRIVATATSAYSPTSFPYLGSVNAPFNTGIQLWANDNVHVTGNGQWSNSSNWYSISINGNLNQCSNTQSVSSVLDAEVSSSPTPVAVGSGASLTVPSDGNLMVGLNVPGQQTPCLQNFQVSASIIRCVDAQGNTYACN